MTEPMEPIRVVAGPYWGGGYERFSEEPDTRERLDKPEGERAPSWAHGMEPDDWLAYRPLAWDEVIARGALRLNGPFDNGDDPVAGEPTWMSRVLARLAGFFTRWT